MTNGKSNMEANSKDKGLGETIKKRKKNVSATSEEVVARKLTIIYP